MSASRSREIYNGRILRLAVQDIRLSDGRSVKRELIKHAGAVAEVALISQQEVLLVRQFRVGAGDSLYEIPAGILEPNEEPRACAIRELREEVGYQPGRLEALGGFYPSPGYNTEYIHLYLATALTQAPLPPDEDETVEVVRLPLTEAVKMIDRQEIVDGKSIIGLLRVVRHLGLTP